MGQADKCLRAYNHHEEQSDWLLCGPTSCSCGLEVRDEQWPAALWHHLASLLRDTSKGEGHHKQEQMMMITII